MNNTSHADDLALWYVSGNLSPDEQARVRSHLVTCAACRAVVSEARASVATLAAQSEPLAPSPELKLKLFARLDADLASERAAAPANPARPITTSAPAPRPMGLPAGLGTWWRSMSPMLALASLAAVAVLLVWNLALQGQVAQNQAELGALTNPNARVVSLPPAGGAPTGAGARVIGAPADNNALLVVYGLKKLGPDKTYEFWLIRGSQTVPAGIFDVDSNGAGSLFVRSAEPVGSFDQGGITIERAGGSPTPDLSALVIAGVLK